MALAQSIAERQALRYDPEQEGKAQEWIEEVTNEAFTLPFGDALKDGQILCRLVNAIRPGSVGKINASDAPFKQMENISNFLVACRNLGVPDTALFETEDLYQLKDLGLVVRGIFALGKTAHDTVPDFEGPHLLSDAQVRAAASSGFASAAAVPPSGEAPSVPAAFRTTTASVGSPTQTTTNRSASFAPSSSYTGEARPVEVGTAGKGRSAGFGIDADIAERNEARYDPDAERKAQGWIEALTGDYAGEASFGDWLKDGQVLCRVVNAINPGTIQPINASNAPFKLMENISNFLTSCRAFGVPETALFETEDLFQLKDLGLVVRCLFALGRAVRTNFPDFTGPQLVSAAAAKEAASRAFEMPRAGSGEGELPTAFQRAPVACRPGQAPVAGNSATAGFYAPSSAYSAEARPVEVGAAGKGRSAGFGIDADIAARNEARYDPGQERKAREWVEAVAGVSFAAESFGEWLRDGQVLCRCVNAIQPGIIAKVSTSDAPFKQMENISAFLVACRNFGVPETALFETVDLHELKDLGLVVRTLFALGRALRDNHPAFPGPHLLSDADAATEQRRTPSGSGAGGGSDAGDDLPSMFKRREKKPGQSAQDAGFFAPSSSYTAEARAVEVGVAGKGRSAGFGIDADIAARQEARYSLDDERKAQDWIETVSGHTFDKPFGEMLRDGQVLCHLANAIRAGSIRRVNAQAMPFKQMENISNFLVCCRNFGVPETALFETVDLHELKDLGLVVRCLFALGRAIKENVPDFAGPHLVSDADAKTGGAKWSRGGGRDALPGAFRR